MKFSQIPYTRVDMANVEERFSRLLEAFQQAASFEEQDKVMGQLNELRQEVESAREVAQIRHTINTEDPFYKEEQDYWDEAGPVYQGIISRYYAAITQSAFRSELEQKWGAQLFRIAETTLRTFSPEVVADLQEENRLASQYVALIASAKIMFEGEERTLPQLLPFQTSTDRNMRKKANEAKYEFLSKHTEELDRIYDNLVKVRDRIAKKLGFTTFVELAYARLNRTDYNAEMVANFRRQVEEQIVPVAARLVERQRERIGVDVMKYYDLAFDFATGNPTPKGSPDWIVENGKKMYEQLSPETDAFYNFMLENECLDLLSKKGKATGGYCTYMSKYKLPYIFANFNGTSGDIDVLTHEAGHAFQVYVSRGYEVPEYHFPTYEACEIHSMSMEFLTWPWMELFFEDDTAKYKFSHLSGSLLFIPYGVAVDEYQHAVYEKPEMTPAERKRTWREIERKYLPYRNYDENEFLEEGGFWQQQGHIFRDPFYYIDYTLAQICAFQFWKRAQENPEQAWSDYLTLCKEGGSKSFTELVKVAKLYSPFEDGCIQSVIGEIETWLNGIDDKQL
ncbi:M3 family oligoendopeptidase [Brevibacillus sp. FSL K6-0770]|uniref:Oligoendopeptidase F n=1 Tax=Brevibacillus parabrevis TaxID=54914 RepID=A0A4Y3PKH1_BREPA|nr:MULTISPECIES: M3 family oligoendopeptidase [Brevibacillus]MBU8712031.1 M3 family oligoendopeptidase [Brevibacillus parabrevis]MDH6349096.1 M3 family oligoendopeptidase [Brevibacillus sp. 1238]MED2257630.1 M3 family oligoendopeptidase [Brevibacillus parabrevis]RNB93679.1 M3 family oligoendopeptidase [Brevibacillus parabrevis]GEB31629.1 oligoendopeptidase F [Brevibacillus parabrevis]